MKKVTLGKIEDFKQEVFYGNKIIGYMSKVDGVFPYEFNYGTKNHITSDWYKTPEKLIQGVQNICDELYKILV